MTGTQSLSAAQVQEIAAEAARISEACKRSGRWVRTASGTVYPGEIVTVVIHEGTPGHGRNKRVQLHRAYGGSLQFEIARNGRISARSYDHASVIADAENGRA